MRVTKLLTSQNAIFNFVKMRSALFCDLPNRNTNDSESNIRSNKSDVNQETKNNNQRRDTEGHHLKSDGDYDMRFKENNPNAGNPGNSDDHRGEFSGNYDKEHHHLKQDGRHDMRFKENRESGIVSPEDDVTQKKK